MSTLSVCPEARSYSCTSPPMAANIVPGPVNFCMMKPSPPKRPAPSLRLKVTSKVTDSSATIKASFCAMIDSPAPSSIGMMFPGASGAKATMPPPDGLLNLVTKALSPEITRPNMPPRPPEPPVFISMLSSIQAMEPDSVNTVSPGPS